MEKIVVVGLGYVGLPLACSLSKYYNVIGFDISKKKIEMLKKGVDITKEVDLSECNVEFSDNEKDIGKGDMVIIAVPTPIDNDNKPDMGYLKSASEIVGRNMKKRAIIVYESTVYPGATEEVCLPILERESGLKVNDGFFLGYSPERINPGDKKHTIDKITKVISASDNEAVEVLKRVYGSITNVHVAPSIKVAEAAKVIENIQRDLNIALMNELSIIFEKIGIMTKDVLDAAGTKWNFHKYTPGLVGGHCFHRDQLFSIRYENDYFTLNAEELYNFSKGKKDVYILSFDVNDRKSKFKRCLAFSKRKYSTIVKIKTMTNQILRVTDDHPVIIWEDGFKVKHAGDISINDKILILNDLPYENLPNKIDIIDFLPEDIVNKTRVKPISKNFRDYKGLIKFRENLGKKGSNFYMGNYIPLKDYLILEKKGAMPIKRDEIYLVSGRGPSFNKIKAVIEITDSFARLIGYYLSEGCVTNDKSMRVRWTFSGDENYLVKDVVSAIEELGLRHSLYVSKKDNAQTIKVSSNIFGYLVLNILKCGKNSYDAQIPYQLFYSDKRLEVLKGILRGDGGVKLSISRKTYSKNKRKYTHNDVSCEVSFFSISKKLFNQTIFLLNDYGVTSSYDLNRPLLYIHGHENMHKMKELFTGKKRKKIDMYFKNKSKYIKSSKYEKAGSFNIIGIEAISKEETDYVYSFEVDDTQTLITDYGIIAHNCIGIDPYYLTYKAEKLGYKPKVILAGREMNDSMHEQVVYLAEKALGKIDGKKILVMGLTFKENVPDYRNSRAVQLIESLKKKGAVVKGHDPFLSENILKDIFGVEQGSLDDEYDLIIVHSYHDDYRKVDLNKISKRLIDIKSRVNDFDGEYFSL